MVVHSKFVVYDSDESFPDDVLRFCRIRHPLSDSDVICFKPTIAQMWSFPHFLRLVKEMEFSGVDLGSAGAFMVDPPAEWSENEANFVVFDDGKDLPWSVHERHEQLGDGYSFRHSTSQRASMKLGRFRGDAARVSDQLNSSDTYDQDAVESPPFTTSFFNEYFRRNAVLVERLEANRYMSKAKREQWYASSNGLLEPPCYAANMDGSLFSTDCDRFNLDCLGTALDHVRPINPGVNSSYLYFSQKGLALHGTQENMSLMSVLFLSRGSAPKVWYTCPDREGFKKLAERLYPEFAAKCPQHVAHQECCVAPELVRAAGLPLNVVVQAERSFVVTGYDVLHFVWNTGYSEACAVNCVDDGYRVAIRLVLEHRLYCQCDTLEHLEDTYDYGHSRDEFWYIRVRRDGFPSRDIRVRRRRDVVTFGMHFFRDSFRAVGERQKLQSQLVDLRGQVDQLSEREHAVLPVLSALQRREADLDGALKSFTRAVGGFFQSGEWSAVKEASMDAKNLALWMTSQSQVSRDGHLSRAVDALSRFRESSSGLSLLVRLLRLWLLLFLSSDGDIVAALESFQDLAMADAAASAADGFLQDCDSSLSDVELDDVAGPSHGVLPARHVEVLARCSSSAVEPKKLDFVLHPRVVSVEGVVVASAPSERLSLPLAAPGSAVVSDADVSGVVLPEATSEVTVTVLFDLVRTGCEDIDVGLAIPVIPLRRRSLTVALSFVSSNEGELSESESTTLDSESTDSSDVDDLPFEVDDPSPNRVRPLQGGSRKRPAASTTFEECSQLASGKWKCNYCGDASFSTRRICRKHQMYANRCVNNTDRKPLCHRCRQCGATFRLRYAMRKHRRRCRQDASPKVKKMKSKDDSPKASTSREAFL